MGKWVPVVLVGECTFFRRGLGLGAQLCANQFALMMANQKRVEIVPYGMAECFWKLKGTLLALSIPIDSCPGADIKAKLEFLSGANEQNVRQLLENKTAAMVKATEGDLIAFPPCSMRIVLSNAWVFSNIFTFSGKSR